MSEIQHTPGPWHVSTKADGLEDGWTVCIMGDGVDLRIRNETPALLGDIEKDADLIAAAPDLLEALEEIVNTPWIGGKGGLVKARAAIAKAKGE